MPEERLVFHGVMKSFGAYHALGPASVSFSTAETVLMLGANGSGKSTFLRMASGLTKPTEGKITSSWECVGFVSQHSMLYGHLTVRENLELFTEMGGRRSSCPELISTWELHREQDRRVCDLSKGQRARVSIARAFLDEPDLLLLDEPTAPLDQISFDLLFENVQALSQRKDGQLLTVVATHDVDRVRRFATRAVRLQDGRVVDDTGPRVEEIDMVIARYRIGNR